MSSAIINKLFTDLGETKTKLEKIRDDKLADFEKAKGELAEALEDLSKFQQFFAKVEAPKSGRKKPGPKGKLGRPKKVVAAPKGKPGPKPKGKPGPKPKVQAKPGPKPKGKPGRPKKVQVKAKPSPKGKNRAAGRAAVARGDRPPIKEAVRTVLGSKTMNAGEILELIKARNWVPNTNDPKGYIAYVLSANKDTFERVSERGRGFYRCVEGKPAEAKPARKKPGPKPKTKPENSGAKNTDAILAEAGVGMGESIFTS